MQGNEEKKVIPILPEVVLYHIASYLLPESLTSIHATAKFFDELLEPIWNKRAEERFGITGDYGRSAWKLGASLVRASKNEHRLCFRPEEVDLCLTGRSVVAKCSSFMAVSSDCWTTDETAWMGAPILIRDIETLRIRKVLRVSCPVWNLAICGPTGKESIVASSGRDIFLLSMNSDQRKLLDFESLDDRGNASRYVSESGIPLIGSEHSLLVYRFGRLFIFNVRDNGEILLCRTRDFLAAELVRQRLLDGIPLPRYHRKALCWGHDNRTFGIASRPGKIHILKLTEDFGGSEQVQTITTDPLHTFCNLSISENFVAACPHRSKRIHVFDIESGSRVHIIEPSYSPYWDDFLASTVSESFDFVDGLQLETLGHLLLTTAKSGNALCLFHLPTGKLLYQTEQAYRSRSCPPVVGISCMALIRRGEHTLVYTHHTGSGSLVWAFFQSNRGQQEAENLAIDHQCRPCGDREPNVGDID